MPVEGAEAASASAIVRWRFAGRLEDDARVQVDALSGRIRPCQTLRGFHEYLKYYTRGPDNES